MDNKGAEVGSIVAVRVDTRDKKANNPRSILGIVYSVTQLQAIRVVCKLGMITHNVTKDMYYSPDNYRIQDNLTTISPSLEAIRIAVINNTYVVSARVSRATAHAELNHVPYRKSCGCRKNCGPTCGCRRDGRQCGSNCACKKNCFVCNNN